MDRRRVRAPPSHVNPHAPKPFGDSVRLAPMPFGPVDPDLDLPTLEQRRLERWKADDTIGATRRLRAGGEPWIFYEGPPTANGRPGLHHVWARVFKDIYPRFQTMRGRDGTVTVSP